MKVEQIIDDIIRREGGFVNHPNDRGGPTKYGITLRTLENYLDRKCTIDDVRNITEELARDIYEEKYWRGPKIDRLPEEVQPFLLDAAVNHGQGNAVCMLQRVCNAAGFGPVGVDGITGPATRRAAGDAQNAMGEWLLMALIEERKNYYRQIVANHPDQSVFFDGWMSRVEEFERGI